MLVCRVLSLWLGIIVVAFTRVWRGMVHDAVRLIGGKSLFDVMCSVLLVILRLLLCGMVCVDVGLSRVELVVCHHCCCDHSCLVWHGA